MFWPEKAFLDSTKRLFLAVLPLKLSVMHWTIFRLKNRHKPVTTTKPIKLHFKTRLQLCYYVYILGHSLCSGF